VRQWLVCGPLPSPRPRGELGEAGAVHADGFLRMAWIDEVDGSPQYARTFLPPDYDPKEATRRWPMVVVLHGYNPPNPEYIHWWGVTERHNGLADGHNVIVVEPHGRGNTGYMGIGDADVLRAIAQAKAAFRVDDARVYLMGYSMGGGGTWHVGTRHPDLFAAIGPIYGGWDWHVWMKDDEAAKLTPRHKYRLESASSFVQADALLTTPVFVNHGDADDLVDPNYSRYAVRMLQRWGYDVRYWEHPGLGHGRLDCEDALLSWFLARRSEADPRHVRVRAGRLKSAEAHWVRVEQREDPNEFIHVDARAIDRNTLRVDTANVLQVRLSPRQAIVDRSKPIRVIWNGELMGDIAMDDGAIVLRAKTYVPGKLFKTPELAGPVDEVQATPFAIVAGTIAKGPLMRQFCLVRAQTARDDWKQWQKVEPRYFLDTQITDEQVRKYTLILFGGPQENLVTQRLAKDLPLKLTPEGVTLAGRHLPAKDASVVMVYPHPLAAGRYVCVHAGNSPAGMFFANRFVEEADFTVADALTSPDTPLEELCVVSGHFDCHWQYEDRFAWRGDAAKRAKAVRMKAPTVLSVAGAAVGGGSLWLADLLPAKAAGSFAMMQRDRNWQGRPIHLGGKAYDRGIGVAVWHEPCVATFDLAGGNFKRLRATIGIAIDKPEKLEPKQKDGTQVYFVVRGDGKELYRSPTFKWDSAPVEMTVPIVGIKTLELEVANEATWHNAAISVDWADVRLEK
jgi:pimeloyl-ACP methyl ester carboxylesterase